MNQTNEERRIELDTKLRILLGNNHTYFQPPESVKLEYDCIVYDLDRNWVKHADNLPYSRMRKYSLVHIHRDPDYDLIDTIGELFQYVEFDRRYVSNNLYHDVYTLYY